MKRQKRCLSYINKSSRSHLHSRVCFPSNETTFILYRMPLVSARKNVFGYSGSAPALPFVHQSSAQCRFGVQKPLFRPSPRAAFCTPKHCSTPVWGTGSALLSHPRCCFLYTKALLRSGLVYRKRSPFSPSERLFVHQSDAPHWFGVQDALSKSGHCIVFCTPMQCTAPVWCTGTALNPCPGTANLKNLRQIVNYT